MVRDLAGMEADVASANLPSEPKNLLRPTADAFPDRINPGSEDEPRGSSVVNGGGKSTTAGYTGDSAKVRCISRSD